MESLKEKAKALLQQCEVVTLTSINKEGYPRPVPLSKIKTEGLTTIWFATGNSSAKTKDFRSNPKAGICFYKEGNSVAMNGGVEGVTNNGTKEKVRPDLSLIPISQPTKPKANPVDRLCLEKKKQKLLLRKSNTRMFENNKQVSGT